MGVVSQAIQLAPLYGSDAHLKNTVFLPWGKWSTLLCFKVPHWQELEPKSWDRCLNTQVGQS